MWSRVEVKPEDVQFSPSPWGHGATSWLGKVEAEIKLEREPAETWAERIESALFQLEAEIRIRCAKRGANLFTQAGIAIDPFGETNVLLLEGVCFHATSVGEAVSAYL